MKSSCRLRLSKTSQLRRGTLITASRQYSSTSGRESKNSGCDLFHGHHSRLKLQELPRCFPLTDGMRRPVSGRDAVRSQVIDVLEAQIKRRPARKKITTVAARQIRNISEQKLTIGLDLGDRSSWYCGLDETGGVLLEQRLSTTPKAMKEVFGGRPRSRIALETGTHSPWVSRLLSEVGHEVIVAHARNVRLIGESRKKDDRLDAQTLARLARIDPKLLWPVKHRGAKAQADLTVIRARAGLVRARTALVNTAPGERGRVSPELRTAPEPLLAGIESLSERIRECNEGIERLARESYPQVGQLKQAKGGGHIDRSDLPADAGRRASFS